MARTRQDPYTKRLQALLGKRGSPLARYAQLIAQTEAELGIPRGLIAGIGIAESGGGVAGAPVRGHNAWGWTAGGPPNFRSFPDWPTAIREYGKFLASNYISKGLDTPEKMVKRYVGSASDTWVRNVNETMSALGGGETPTPPSPPLPTQNPQEPPVSYANPKVAKRARKNLQKAIELTLSGGDVNQAWAHMLRGMQLMGRVKYKVAPLRAPADAQAGLPNTGEAFYAGRGLLLPAKFSSDHPTSGLAGFPARDFMAKGGTPVFAPFSGVIAPDRPFGWAPTQNPAAGFGGARLYLRGQADTDPDLEEAYIAHLARNLRVRPGQRVKKGQLLGYVWDWPGNPGRSHVHYGLRGL